MPEIVQVLIDDVPKPLPPEPFPLVPKTPIKIHNTPNDGFHLVFEPSDTPGIPPPDVIANIPDGDMMPLMTVTPDYPQRAASRRIEGWCQISLTVTETGGVRDVQAVDCYPENVFERASIRAAERFRYSPRIRDGQPVEAPDTHYLFRFTLQ